MLKINANDGSYDHFDIQWKHKKVLPRWQKAWQAERPLPWVSSIVLFKSKRAAGMSELRRCIWALLLKHEALWGVNKTAWFISSSAFCKSPFSASLMASFSYPRESLKKQILQYLYKLLFTKQVGFPS